MTQTSTPVPRSRRARAVAELVPAISATAFRRFGFMQNAVIARWSEIVGDQYAGHSVPQSLRFPPGKRSGGTLQVGVTGAFAPLLAAVEPMIVERVNRFFGYAAVARLALRHGDLPVKCPPRGASADRALPPETTATLRDIADPELRASLESLARALGATEGPPRIG